MNASEPGRVVARITHRAEPPVDSHVYDEWTAEAEAEAAEAARAPATTDEGSLEAEPPPGSVAPRSAASGRAGWLLLFAAAGLVAASAAGTGVAAVAAAVTWMVW